MFSTNFLRKLDMHMQNRYSRHRNTRFLRINSKWTTDLSVNLKTLTLLEDNIGECLHNLVGSGDFSNTTPKTSMIDKLDFIEIKTSTL